MVVPAGIFCFLLISSICKNDKNRPKAKKKSPCKMPEKAHGDLILEFFENDFRIFFLLFGGL
jgi:hypothetical protein